MGETDTESMEREKLWDARRPTMNRWWETAVDENDLVQETMASSPEAQQAARLWVEQNVRKTPQTVDKRKQFFVKKNSPRKTVSLSDPLYMNSDTNENWLM
ncbi:Hypothetical protein CINCED_3A005551 [Cinara cedri]|uniref:Uncharacterized protein n=1 Tax=Cinara cedri TaxID=506608 RepID=A0A5E4MGQ6_9HEMI|nr:Hypothetical protein CINCED_3A005551 [Cinara cedri]